MLSLYSDYLDWGGDSGETEEKTKLTDTLYRTYRYLVIPCCTEERDLSSSLDFPRDGALMDLPTLESSTVSRGRLGEGTELQHK